MKKEKDRLLAHSTATAAPYRHQHPRSTHTHTHLHTHTHPQHTHTHTHIHTHHLRKNQSSWKNLRPHCMHYYLTQRHKSRAYHTKVYWKQTNPPTQPAHSLLAIPRNYTKMSRAREEPRLAHQLRTHAHKRSNTTHTAHGKALEQAR